MIDLLGDIVSFATTDSNAASVRALLGDNPETKICTDFDPANVVRPYIIVLQSKYDNEYKPLGNTMRVENLTVQFLAFTDTRAECISILDTLDSCFTSATFGLGTGVVMDKVAQLDLNKIDAYRGTLNMVYHVQQNQ